MKSLERRLRMIEPTTGFCSIGQVLDWLDGVPMPNRLEVDPRLIADLDAWGDE